MGMITLTPATATDWPATEASPYVDWWTRSDKVSGKRDQSALATIDLAIPPDATGVDRRYRPLHGAGLAQRRLAIWTHAAPPPDQGGPEFGSPLPPRPASADKAILVVIDTAINPLHDRPRTNAGGSRILAHWLMEGTHRPDRRVHFGRELRQTELDDQLASNLPEDRALGQLGVFALDQPFGPRGASQTAAHGAHVIGLAGGADPLDRSASATALRDAPVLAVSLPSDRLMSASGVFLDLFVGQALAWVTTRLTQLYPAEPPQVIVNLSYGLAAGPGARRGCCALRRTGLPHNAPAPGPRSSTGRIRPPVTWHSGRRAPIPASLRRVTGRAPALPRPWPAAMPCARRLEYSGA